VCMCLCVCGGGDTHTVTGVDIVLAKIDVNNAVANRPATVVKLALKHWQPSYLPFRGLTILCTHSCDYFGNSRQSIKVPVPAG
jgi:hypothetical protein